MFKWGKRMHGAVLPNGLLAFILFSFLTLGLNKAYGSNPAVTGSSDIRIQYVHLAPQHSGPGTFLSFAISGHPPIVNLAYGEHSGYIDLPLGDFEITVRDGASGILLHRQTLAFTQNGDFSIFLAGGGGRPLALVLGKDDNAPLPPGWGGLRVGHMATFGTGPNGPLVDLRLEDGTILLDNVPFGTLHGFVPVPPGAHDLAVTTADGGAVLIDPAPILVHAGERVSAVAAGDGVLQPFGVYALTGANEGAFVPLENNEPRGFIYLAHLAPFAADPNATVTIRFGNDLILRELKYGDSTGYLDCPIGPYAIEIIPEGASQPLVRKEIILEENRFYTALAVGDGVNQPPDIVILEDDNAFPPPHQARLRFGHVAPFAPPGGDLQADIRLQDGTVLVDDLDYGIIKDQYLTLPAGFYDLKVTSADGQSTLIDPLPIHIGEGDVSTLLATGDGANQPLGVYGIINFDPGGFLPLATGGTATIKLIHLASFAPREMSGVKITHNGVELANGLLYGETTEFLDVDAGPASFVVTDLSDQELTAANATLDNAKTYVGVLNGDNVNEPLALDIIEILKPPFGTAAVLFGHMAPLAEATADVRLQDGTVLLNDVSFGAVTPANTLILPAGRYDFVLTSPDGSRILFDPVPVYIRENDVVTALLGNEPDAGTAHLLAVINDRVEQIPSRFQLSIPVLLTPP